MSPPGSELESGTRATAMARSVASAARSVGLGEADIELVGSAVALAMEPRITALPDDHHPAYLHPGRTVLVLLRDVGALGARALSVGAVLESEDPSLRAPPERYAEVLGSAEASWLSAALAEVPLPGDPRLVERLVGLDDDVVLAAIAERLDHLRHLHLRDDLRSVRADRHEEVTRAWLPVAHRAHPRLATRLEHWARSFERRL